MEGESVLVVPAAVLHRAGVFHGFSPQIDHYLPRLLGCPDLAYLPRAEAEVDPTYKQLIPYVVLRSGGRVFHYRRGQGGSEQRLRARRSIGIGGHVSDADGPPSAEAYRAGMLRELAEEVLVETGYRERCLGLINDDRTPVGQVHLGIVHVFDLEEPLVREREDVVAESGFSPLDELRADREAFETWSQFLLDGPWLEGG
jgi:predicted NUDIX family phosphoesterase